MSELIDREALKDAVRRYAGEPIKAKDKKCQAICLDMLGTIDAQPAAAPWHSVEEPPQSGQECFTAYRSILRSEPEWLYDICYYTDDLARDCLLMDGAEHRSGWYRYESEYGDVECHPKYWMPILPPKEA